MTDAWCQLGASTVKNGTVYVRCKGNPVDEDGTAPDYGQAPMMCALGVEAVPYQPTKEGCAEGLVARLVSGISGVIKAARDVRWASVVGKLQPGDTCIRATGPNQAAMAIFKEAKRIAALLTKAESGKTIMIALDGTEDKVTISHPSGSAFEMSKNGDISILGSGGAGILIQKGNVHFLGNPVIGAGNPRGFCFALVPPTGSPGGVASLPLLAATGITPGT